MNRISAKAEIAKTAIIHDEVEIGEGAVIHDYVVVYPGTVVKAGAEVYDHCVLGKLPTSPGSTTRVYSSGYEKTVIGENCILCPGVVLYTGTTIGHNTLLGDYCSIREKCVIGDYCIISRNVSVNYETTIGSYTKIVTVQHPL